MFWISLSLSATAILFLNLILHESNTLFILSFSLEDRDLHFDQVNITKDGEVE